MKEKIDFVMLWVDGNDFEWQDQFQKYSGVVGDKKNIRFRDWNNLHYWFRAIEKYAPWVNKIHFVTWGHIPIWLNIDHPKINIVKHDQIINEEYLPLFNSCAIELNIHKIPDLAEQFVYFNDDTFIIKKVEKQDFFKNGLPRDEAIPNPALSNSKNGVGATISNNMEIINTYFNKRDSMKKNIFKWFHPYYKQKNIASMLLLPWNFFTSFGTTHLPNSFLKSTFYKVWEKEEEALIETTKSRFRNRNNLNQWVMRYWQLASGNFTPRNINFGKSFMLGKTKNNKAALASIKKQKYAMICLNDSDGIKDFEGLKKEVLNAFEEKLPEKSSYEK